MQTLAAAVQRYRIRTATMRSATTPAQESRVTSVSSRVMKGSFRRGNMCATQMGPGLVEAAYRGHVAIRSRILSCTARCCRRLALQAAGVASFMTFAT